jgi:citrate synthase
VIAALHAPADTPPSAGRARAATAKEHEMSTLKRRLAAQIPAWQERVRTLAKEHGDVVLGQTTVGAALGGMRGLKALVCDTSYLDPMEGIRFRGYTIPEVRAKLPKPAADQEAYPTGLFWLLLTGELPSEAEVAELEADLRARSAVPQFVYDVLRALPADAHPMTQFSVAITAMQPLSRFASAYASGTLAKTDYWEPTLEDALDLIARLPVVAAYIYRRCFKHDTHIAADPKLDWGANFAHMMGVPDPAYQDLMRLYLLLHIDHEGGNVSAHTSHVVGSALSDVYLSVAAGINGLAGPLHGLANQECLKWINDVMEHFGGAPTAEQVEQFAWETLNSGRVIPGFGHAVLRNTDPRYTAQRQYSIKRGMGEHPVVKTVHTLFDVIPGVLKEQGKAKSPWPNVDAHSGALQVYYGVTEADFYTVLFGVSRAMGIVSQLVWDRAMGMPLERPKSVTVKMLEAAAGVA